MTHTREDASADTPKTEPHAEDASARPAPPSTDPQEARLISLFCQGPALQTCLASFCRDTQNAKDPVLHVLLIALNASVQIQLTGVGLQLFQVGRATLRTRMPNKHA